MAQRNRIFGRHGHTTIMLTDALRNNIGGNDGNTRTHSLQQNQAL